MIRIVVTTAVQSRNDPRTHIQFPVEIAGASTVEEVYERLCDKGALFGNRVNFNFVGERGTDTERRVVRERIPFIVTLAGALTIGPCPYSICEEDGEVSADD